jgi:hypothetical protein
MKLDKKKIILKIENPVVEISRGVLDNFIKVYNNFTDSEKSQFMEIIQEMVYGGAYLIKPGEEGCYTIANFSRKISLNYFKKKYK